MNCHSFGFKKLHYLTLINLQINLSPTLKNDLKYLMVSSGNRLGFTNNQQIDF